MTARTLSGRWYRGEREGWFRVLGWGLALRDHSRMRPLWSERYSGQFGVPARVYLHVGRWCVAVLRP